MPGQPRHILPALLLLSWIFGLSLCSCSNKRPKRPYQRADTICVDSASYFRADTASGYSVLVRIMAQYPTPVTGVLSANIASWVRSRLGTGLPPDTMDVQSVVDYYGSRLFSGAFAGSGKPDLRFDATVRFVAQRRNYVSMRFMLRQCAGGTPGLTTDVGTTFRRTDGVAFGWNMLRDTSDIRLHNIMREGVRSYFATLLREKEVSDISLVSLLESNYSNSSSDEDFTILRRFPLPKCQPYLSRRGMTFVYQPYEIAPYSAGAPQFTVPFSEIKPYLSDVGQRLIRKL